MNLFCLLKEIVSYWGVDKVYVDDSTPICNSSLYWILCLPRWVLKLFYRVSVIGFHSRITPRGLVYDIVLDEKRKYTILKVVVRDGR